MNKTFFLFHARSGDRDQQIEMLKNLGNRVWSLFFRCTVLFFLFTLTVYIILRSLDSSVEHRIKFYPPDDVMNYLAAEHKSLEEIACRITPQSGTRKDIPFESFHAELIQAVKPVKIRGDEYGIYLITTNSWYHGGEYGIFIAKDEKRMPPDMNWGLIEGRIFAYAFLQ